MKASVKIYLPDGATVDVSLTGHTVLTEEPLLGGMRWNARDTDGKLQETVYCPPNYPYFVEYNHHAN